MNTTKQNPTGATNASPTILTSQAATNTGATTPDTTAPVASDGGTTNAQRTTMKIADIDMDNAIQTRVAIDEEVVEEYAQLMRQKVKFPPIAGIRDEGGVLWVTDGIHRLKAASKAGLTEIDIEIQEGDRFEAVMHALRANSRHGIRRTNADKRKAVEIALKEFPKWSGRVLAKLCGVANQLVSTMRREMEEGGEVCESHTSKLKGQDGKSYPARTRKRPPVTGTPEPTAPAEASTSPAEQGAGVGRQPTTSPVASTGAASTSNDASAVADQEPEKPQEDAREERSGFTTIAGKGTSI